MCAASFFRKIITMKVSRYVVHVLCSGKLSREKTFVNFTVSWLYVKVFSAKFGAWHLWHGKSEQSAKVFSAKIVFFTNLRKCSPSKVSRYTV